MAIIGTGVVVLVVAGWLTIRRARPSGVPPNVVEPRVVPLTSLLGVELHPALSPDGTRVAFIWHGPNRDNFDVYVKDITGGQMVRVTQDPAPDYRPVWSPEGKHIAFLRAQETGLAVFLVSPGGEHEQRLTDIASPLTFSRQDLWLSSLDWSPDGRFLAVADQATDSTWGVVLVSVETGARQMLTGNTEVATADLFPTFSPDGRRLAFHRGGPAGPGGWDLVIQPLSSDTPPRARGDAVVRKEVTPGAITWLPSGDELVVAGQRVPLDGSPARPLRPSRWMSPPEPSFTDFSGVSVRGTKLVFDTAEFRPQLLRLPLTGALKPTLAPFFPSTRGEWDPAVAPDGRRVAFASLRSGDGHI
jgi:Tol biopolymer transport system component